MSTNTRIIDTVTRHQVFLQRYAAGESKKAVKALNRLRRDINARLMQEPTAFQAARLRAVLDDIDRLAIAAFGDISTTTKYGAQLLAESEASFSAGVMSKLSTGDFALPSTASLISAVDNAPMVPRAGSASISLDAALRELGAKKARQIGLTIADAVALGDTTQDVARKVGTMIDTLTRRQVTSLVSTAMNHASSVAREETYKANANLLDGYEWVSTLDSHTTLVCAGRDGKVYQIGIGPMPAAHWGCRSTTIPKVKAEYSLAKPGGSRPSIGADGVEQVGANKSYGGWLKDQPAAFQDEALGPERAKLFRSGKVSIDKFTDPTGRVYTLQQLESMHNIALQ